MVFNCQAKYNTLDGITRSGEWRLNMNSAETARNLYRVNETLRTELEELRIQLKQERQDHGHNIRQLKITASEMLKSKDEQLENCKILMARIENERNAALKTDQEPVAWMHETEGLSYENYYAGNVPLYTAPPSRHLSDEDIVDLWDLTDGDDRIAALAFARSVLEKANG